MKVANDIAGRPDEARLLSDALFRAGDPPDALRALSRGIGLSLDNAGQLLRDAEPLVAGESYASAELLVAAAREEMGKAYLLVDMCRLDFERHLARLDRLCEAFYSSAIKHAYYQICARKSAGIGTMGDVRRVLDLELRRYHGPAPEDESVDPTHDLYPYRKAGIFVDFDPATAGWVGPSSQRQVAQWTTFSLLGSPLEQTSATLEKFEVARTTGLTEPEKLETLNYVFSPHYIDETTSLKQVDSLYEEVSFRLKTSFGIPYSDVEGSEIWTWPLYAFL